MNHRPDIVLLVLDALRADRLSCYGYPIITSPYLDVVANESTLFTLAVAPAPWTIPAHASLFTGLYPSQHRMLQMNSTLAATHPTLAERLTKSGYHTMGISNNPLVGVLENGLQRGFADFVNYGGLLTLLTRHDDEERAPRRTYVHRPKRILGDLLHEIQSLLARSSILSRILFSPLILSLWQSALKRKGNLKGDTSQTLTDATRLLIERPGLSHGQPVFIFINLMGTHIPYDPPLWAVKRFAPHLAGLTSLATYLRRFNLDVYRWQGPLSRRLNEEQSRSLNGLYNAEVAAQDAELGIFFERLRTAGILDRILLVVTSDHGEHLGEKDLVGHGFGAYEAVSHVPLIVRDLSGGLPQGVKFDIPISTRRLFYTFLRAADIASPVEKTLALADLPENRYVDRQDSVLTEAEPLSAALNRLGHHRRNAMRHFIWNEPHRAIYHEWYKLIAIGQSRWELFDLKNDPLENRDLSTVLPDKVSEMREHLDKAMQQMNVLMEGPSALEDDLMVKQRLKLLGYLEETPATDDPER
jgi:arylsulfatase A-like enzyme